MWKRGGRSSALDRAQALLSAGRSSRRDGQGSTLDSPATTQGRSGGSIQARPVLLNTHASLCDLRVNSAASEHRSVDAGNKCKEKLDSDKSSLGGGSRFLKKVSATNNRQSSVSRKQTEQVLEPRYVPSSQSCKQVLEQVRQKTVSPPADTWSMAVSTDQSHRGNIFLKKKADLAAKQGNISPAVSPKSSEAGVKSRSRVGGPVQQSPGLDMKPLKVMSTLDLESDEEDMRKLLGDSMDSSDDSFLDARRPSSCKNLDKMFSHGSGRDRSRTSPVAPSPSNTAAPRSPASPPHQNSPFRFTGQAQAHFSPSVLSPSPSPPLPLPPPPNRCSSSLKVEHPQQSQSATPEVLSLEELFPGGPGSEDPQEEMSSVPSEDFNINVMTVDELAPALDRFSANTQQEQMKPAHPEPGLPKQELLQEKDQKEEEEEEEEVLHYQSDFESDSSTSQISEHMPGDREEEDVPSEASMVSSHRKSEDDDCRGFSDHILSSTSQSSDFSSRSSTLHGSSDSPRRRRRCLSTEKAVKDSAAQTQADLLSDPWSTGQSGTSTLNPTFAIYMNPAPGVPRLFAAERLEAIRTFDPAVFALNEMLKQQLAVTRRFMDSSQRLHSFLLQSLEPPDYRYTKLEDTVQNICKHRSPKLTTETAMEAVLREMKDNQR